MEILNKIWAYLTFKKSEVPTNGSLKMMHGINKISIYLFLAGVIYMIVRFSK